MSENTKIEWADHTFNPWIGCVAISPGCANCYAADWATRYGKDFAARTRTKTWGDAVKWNTRHDAFFATHGRRQRVFCASLADVFDNAVDPQWRADLFELILATPNLDWLLLTKRIGNVGNMLPVPFDFDKHYPNVWIGATVVNQEEADRDIPKLLDVPAAKRFLSMEPLLGPVVLRFPTKTWDVDRCDHCCNGDRCDDPSHYDRRRCPFCRGTGKQKFLDWVIVGGESGPGARPMHPDWARSLRDQCEKAGVPFLFKQWGEWNPGTVQMPLGTKAVRIEHSGAVHPWPPIFDPLSGDHCMHKVGKTAAGRLLDGRTWDGFPS